MKTIMKTRRFLAAGLLLSLSAGMLTGCGSAAAGSDSF